MRSALYLSVITLTMAGGAPAAEQPKDAEPATRAVHEQFLKDLPFDNLDDFEAARRGFIAGLPGGQIKGADGNVVWDMKGYAFEEADSPPPTVNPSLWRQEQLNNLAGLFKVADRIYQIRGFDLSNMTLIEGDSGLIIIDPLISKETAAAGLALYRKEVGDKPVVAVIHSHSHIDHYGGVEGVVSKDDVKAGKVKIYAPAGFLQHVIEENVYAGTAMSRRAQYMYGALLEKGPRGQVGAGLGKTTSLGTVTLIPPTDVIGTTMESRTIDGVEVQFQLTPGTEAPAEMNMYFPQFKALCAAENATHTMHNILTLRGAEVRDPKIWSAYLTQTIDLFGDKIEVLFAQHHWPTWGRDAINTFLADQRDMYQYLNDQTLRLINHGYTPMEIAETLKTLPPKQARKWYNRDYYGSISHNVRAIYQRYIGFYDGNPATLNPLPPVEAAKRYVDFMGGADQVIAKARASFAKGEFRWVAEVMNHVVFAEPDNQAARNLAADALEQLGYQSENGTWRNNFLMGAHELRSGVPKIHIGGSVSPDTVTAMTPDLFFDYLAIRLNGEKAADVPEMVLNWDFTDIGEKYALTLRNAALSRQPSIVERSGPSFDRPDVQDAKADATVTLAKATLDDIALGHTTIDKAVEAGDVKIEGDGSKLKQLFALFDSFNVMFDIVTPKPAGDGKPRQTGMAH